MIKVKVSPVIIPVKKLVDNPEAELERFEKARIHAISQLGTLYEVSLEKLGEQNAVVFQIHQMMLEDPDYVNSIRTLIKKEKVNAEYAVDTVGHRFEQQFKSMVGNDYMQGRAADVVDISRRINEILMMHSGQIKHRTIALDYGDDPVIVATDDLAPSETVQLDPHKVSGILTSGGSNRSHTVIFARTLAEHAPEKEIARQGQTSADIKGVNGHGLVEMLKRLLGLARRQFKQSGTAESRRKIGQGLNCLNIK